MALVTGGGRGIGPAIGVALGSAGARVALAAAAVRAEGGSARGWTLDVTDLETVAAVVGEVEAELGPVTLLVNNAGTAHAPGPLWEVDPDDWWQDLEVHVRGAFNCCRVVVAGGLRAGRSRFRQGGVGLPP